MLLDIVLNKIGDLLICQTPIKKADYVTLLLGTCFDRVREVIDIHKRGLANKILLIDDTVNAYGHYNLKKIGINHMTQFEINLEVCRAFEIKRSNIEIVQCEYLFSTYDEINAIKKHLIKSNCESLIFVTSQYHSRRSYRIFKKVFKGTNIMIMCQPTNYDSVDIRNWWKNRYPRKMILEEYLKCLYYYFKY